MPLPIGVANVSNLSDSSVAPTDTSPQTSLSSSRMYSQQKGRERRGGRVLRGWRGDFGGGGGARAQLVVWQHANTDCQSQHARETDLEDVRKARRMSASNRRPATRSLATQTVKSGTTVEYLPCSVQLTQTCTDLRTMFHGRVGARTAHRTS
ncbi:hypothetical protein HBI29_190550 [Parastagonospora nodorum]|nr:hypothetical protein HBH52_120630 [Parastagonospora nodorum]KAH5493011.1 hypothetical protein HBI29_190550 [Parastagonospora nodorum]